MRETGFGVAFPTSRRESHGLRVRVRRGRPLRPRLQRFRSNPAIHLGYLKFPQPAQPVGRHTLTRYPTIEGVSGDTEMGTHFLDRRPSFVRRRSACGGLSWHKQLIVAKNATTCTERMTSETEDKRRRF